MSIRSRNALIVIVATLVVISVAIELNRGLRSSCPSDWSDVRRVPVQNGRHGLGPDGPGTIGISALLDYMPHPDVPFGRSSQAHPLAAVVTVSSNETELQQTTVECIRITHGEDAWARKPQLHPIQVSPSSGQAWRLAIADDGPEWPTGDAIQAEAWVTFTGRRYIFDFGSFPLMKGG